ncbi:MAG: hypothetical protein ACK4U0_17270 [Mesorhizobium sp.]
MTARMPATGAPMPAPVWQMICEFANGHCLCAARGVGPCEATALVAARIRSRVELDIMAERRPAKERAA